MKTLRIIPVLMIAVIGILFTSCESCIEGNGIIVTETRIVSNDFDRIQVDGSFEVYFTQDSVVSIEVEGDENLLSYVTTVTRRNVLEIDQTNRCFNVADPIRVYVSAPKLFSAELDGSGVIDGNGLYMPGEKISIELDGSGIIEFGNILAESIDVNLGGSGDIYLFVDHTAYLDARITGSGTIDLRGEAVETEFTIPGSGDIRAFRLDQEDCDARISGSGSMYVFVYDNLWVDVTGSGYVFYRGNPDIYLDPTTDPKSLINDNYK